MAKESMLKEIFQINLSFYINGDYHLMKWKDISTSEVMQFHKKQIEALKIWNDDTTTGLGFGGSARGGKSLLICAAILFDCFAFPGSAYLLGRKNLTELNDTTWKTWHRLLTNFGFEEESDWSHNQRYNEFQFHEPKSSVYLKALEFKPSDPESTKLGSLEITKAAIDQSENVDLRVVQKVFERVGSKMNEHYDIKGKVMEVFNPSSTHTKQRYWVPFRDDKETESQKFVRALPTDNPGKEAKRWVDEKIKDYHDGIMTQVEYEKQILGNFDYDDDPNKIFDQSAAMSMFENDYIKPNYDATFMTVDPAGQGKDSSVIWVWHGKRYVAVTYEIKNISSKDLIKVIKEYQNKYGIPNNKVIYDASGLGNYISGYIKGAIAFYGNSNKFSNKEKKLYPNLRTLCYYSAAMACNRGNIYIADKTHKSVILNELSHIKSVSNDPDGKRLINKKDEVKKNLGKSPDHADNIMMSRMAKTKVTSNAAV